LALIGSSLIACSLAATIQTTAVCSSDFSWTTNSLGQSPCEVAANVDAVCNSGNGWIVPALNGSVVYDVPVGPSATACTCYWASYNLISACTDCQGYSNETTSWLAYSYNCAGKLDTDTYFPANLTLEGALIPYWATTNPTTWADGSFNAATAQNISSKGNPDVGGPSTSTKSKPIGAIVGGVIGGIVVLLGAIIVGIFLIRRTSRPPKNADPSPLLMSNHNHFRSQSDVTANNMSTPNMSTPLGYTSLSSSPMHPTSPTIRTHASSSIRSFPFFSSGGSTVHPPSLRQQSPPPVPAHRDETAVEPFTLAPSNNYNPDRKQANGAYPMYDQPTAPPAVRMEVRSTTPTQGGRTRYNPPAYTEQTRASPEAVGGSSSRQRSPPTGGQGHGTKGSEDTQQSFTLGSTARVGGSNPAMGNRLARPTGPVMNPQMSHDASASNSAIASTGHGRQLNGNTSGDMGRNRPPATDDSFSVGDIA